MLFYGTGDVFEAKEDFQFNVSPQIPENESVFQYLEIHRKSFYKHEDARSITCPLLVPRGVCFEIVKIEPHKHRVFLDSFTVKFTNWPDGPKKLKFLRKDNTFPIPAERVQSFSFQDFEMRKMKKTLSEYVRYILHSKTESEFDAELTREYRKIKEKHEREIINDENLKQLEKTILSLTKKYRPNKPWTSLPYQSVRN